MEAIVLAKIFNKALDEKRLSYRAAANEIGVSHSTVGRVVRGEPADMPTIEKIAAWLNVPPSTLVDIEEEGDAGLAKRIESFVAQYPELARVFDEAIQRVEDGSMEPVVLRELIMYVSYRINNV
jgi:transcriptional regulator with XRE-family HTH domain